MPLEEPAWWYADAADRRVALLRPLAKAFAWIGAQRAERTTPYRSRLPVICVGNFTAGGTGKTPLALHLAGLLLARGMKPAFLTRGYGGSQRGPVWVETALHTARDVGDEPLLLARTAPVMVARDRAAGARMIESSGRADIVVMDDGLQNPGLAKDLVIAVVDGRRGIGNGEVIPAGPLRAPLETQLALAHCILVNQPPAVASVDDHSVMSQLRERYQGPVIEARVAVAGDVAWLKARPLVAFAGIANPRRFFDLLEAQGAHLNGRESFADHHELTDAEAEDLLARARYADAGIVTTEKDWARLVGRIGACGRLGQLARPLPIRLDITAPDAAKLTELIEKLVGGTGARPEA